MENLQRLYDMLEADNEHSLNLVIRCVLDNRLDLIDRAAAVAVSTIENGELIDAAYVEQSDLVAELYESRTQQPSRVTSRFDPTAKGGRCRSCGGLTTYTRQNSESGLCSICEHEGKPGVPKKPLHPDGHPGGKPCHCKGFSI